MKERQDQDEVYAAGSSIEDSLKRLSERRTDIFGVGIEETQIGKKVRNIYLLIFVELLYNQLFLLNYIFKICPLASIYVQSSGNDL